MSRVIKSAVWQEKPCVVEAPHIAVSSIKDTASRSDDAVREDMMAAALEKQKRADEMLEKAQHSCDTMKKQAQEEHDAILQKAQQEAADLKKEAMDKGHDEGIAAGHDEGMAKAAAECHQSILDANTTAEKTMLDAKNECHVYVERAEDTIASLAIQIVEKILPQHFIDVPQIVLPLVRKAILKVKDQNEVVVHIAPDYYDIVLMARSEFQSMLTGSAMLEVKSDDSLKAGDVVVETPNGTVDAKLATQIELIKQAIQEVMS